MKFLYEYRTADNAPHSGAISAADRDAAFAALKAQGVRPSRLVEAPGFFNKLFGKGKRWLAITVLAALLVAVVIALISADRRADRSFAEVQAVQDVFDSPVRRQLIGDAAVIEKGIKTGWADVFSAEGDRYLASFAIPGQPPAVTTTTDAALRAALSTPHPLIPSSLSLEHRQLLAIVAGLKADISAHLNDGWTLDEIRRALLRRQQQEIDYYNRAKNEIDQLSKSSSPAALGKLWERRNDELRAMGIATLPLPE